MINKGSLKKISIMLPAAILLVLLYFFADARYSSIFPRCIFYLLTGLYCPGCGSQRAFSSILHGDIRQAIDYNILFMICLPFLFYAGCVALINIFRKKQLVQHIFNSTLFVRIVVAVIMIFWVARNIPVYPFSLLAPHAIH